MNEDVFRDNAESAYAEVRRLTAENKRLLEERNVVHSKLLRKVFLNIFRLMGVAGVVILALMYYWLLQTRGQPTKVHDVQNEDGCLFSCVLPSNPSEDDRLKQFDCENKQHRWQTLGRKEYLRDSFGPKECRYDGGIWKWKHIEGENQ